MLGSLLSLVGLGLAPTAQAAVRAGEINIIATHSGRCVEAAGSSTSAGAAVVQADCTGQAGAVWRLESAPVGGGAVQIVNANSGRCMEVSGTAVGSPVTQADCGTQPSAGFRMVDRGTHVWLQPLTPTPAKCLEVAGGSLTPGTAVRLAECGERAGTAFHQRVPGVGNDPAGGGPPKGVHRVNVLPDGSQAPGGVQVSNHFSHDVSSDGRYVTFSSGDRQSVPNDANNATDVFVRDRQTGTTEIVSLTSFGQQGNGDSGIASISADGRYVVFRSNSTNLTPGATLSEYNVFLRDRKTGITELISRSATGQPDNDINAGDYPSSVSEDGRYVVFHTTSKLDSGDVNGTWDVYVRDRQAGTVELVNRSGDPNVPTKYGSVSSNGRYVIFAADGSIISGGIRGVLCIFVRDLRTGIVEPVSVSDGEAQPNGSSRVSSISADGRYVAFESSATNLPKGGGDTNKTQDIFVRDRQAGTTERVNVDSNGVQSLIDAYFPDISDDGRYVSFETEADNLVPYDTNSIGDVFVRDRTARSTVRVSTDDDGVQGNGRSGDLAKVSADGRHVSFASRATNLVTGDTNRMPDLFMRPMPKP